MATKSQKARIVYLAFVFSKSPFSVDKVMPIWATDKVNEKKTMV